MKTHWARCEPLDSLCIGPMTIEEFAEFGYSGVYRNPWPNGRETAPAVPYVRPATQQEIRASRDTLSETRRLAEEGYAGGN